MATKLFFPLDAGKVSWNSEIKHTWTVSEFISASGERKTISSQILPKITFMLNFPCLSRYEVDDLLSFYAKTKGSWRPFYYKDYEDFLVQDKILTKTDDGVYIATIEHGGFVEEPEQIDNVTVYVDGKKTDKFSVLNNRIVVNKEGVDVRFDYEFYYKVYFSDEILVKQLFDDVYAVSLTLTVAR